MIDVMLVTPEKSELARVEFVPRKGERLRLGISTDKYLVTDVEHWIGPQRSQMTIIRTFVILEKVDK